MMKARGIKSMREDIIIRQESAKDYKEIVSLILRSFKEGTNYSDGSLWHVLQCIREKIEVDEGLNCNFWKEVFGMRTMSRDKRKMMTEVIIEY